MEQGTAAAEGPTIEEVPQIEEHPQIGEINRWPMNSIFRVPEHIRSGREPNFEPKLVSIGPYYHGLEKLQRMENLKLRCITDYLLNIEDRQNYPSYRRPNPTPLEAGIPHRQNYPSSRPPSATPLEADIQNRSIYMVSIKPAAQGNEGIVDVHLDRFMNLGQKACAFYKEEFDQSDEVEFVRMLVIDSCFIIRTIHSLSQEVQESMAFSDVHIEDVRSDLLLLENQIPLFFIREVYEWLFSSTNRPEMPPFHTVLEPFLCLDMPWTINHSAMMASKEAAHLLDLYWRCSLSPPMYKKLSERERDLSEKEKHGSEPERDLSEREQDLSEKEQHGFEQEQPTFAEIHFANNALMVIANATELQQMAGIEFKKFEEKGHLDVIFAKGIMQMPRLKIDSRHKTLLRNLIAFENCILPNMRTISCYMKLMDALIDSEKDVDLLQKGGVIYNTLSSHEMAATFFNDIGNFCFIDGKTNHFSHLYKNVQKYYNSTSRRRWANLKEKYFSSPWAGISVIAAGILLILSALQTFYTIYGYYKPKN